MLRKALEMKREFTTNYTNKEQNFGQKVRVVGVVRG
jgi:hypothetical protein